MVMDEDDDLRDERPGLESRGGSLLDYRMDSRYDVDQVSDGSDRDEEDIDDHPPLLSSPSAASSIGPFSNAVSPLRRELSRTTLHDEPDNVSTSSGNRLALARRLSHLAHQLTNEDDVDELALMAQVDQMEKALAQPGSRSPPKRRIQHRRPASFGGWRSHGDNGGPLLASHHSELSASLLARNPIPESGEASDSRKGLTIRQANKIVAEANKLNEELTSIVSNLKARQEESDVSSTSLSPSHTSLTGLKHIHDLLVERAERAAQRIIFLQTRISYLESELAQNDDELQNLRICLKAVEIQMPPHPDPSIQKCIASFKEDYQRLRKKRASRGMVEDGETTMSPGRGPE